MIIDYNARFRYAMNMREHVDDHSMEKLMDIFWQGFCYHLDVLSTPKNRFLDQYLDIPLRGYLSPHELTLKEIRLLFDHWANYESNS